MIRHGAGGGTCGGAFAARPLGEAGFAGGGRVMRPENGGFAGDRRTGTARNPLFDRSRFARLGKGRFRRDRKLERPGPPLFRPFQIRAPPKRAFPEAGYAVVSGCPALSSGRYEGPLPQPSPASGRGANCAYVKALFSSLSRALAGKGKGRGRRCTPNLRQVDGYLPERSKTGTVATPSVDRPQGLPAAMWKCSSAIGVAPAGGRGWSQPATTITATAASRAGRRGWRGSRRTC